MKTTTPSSSSTVISRYLSHSHINTIACIFTPFASHYGGYFQTSVLSPIWFVRMKGRKGDGKEGERGIDIHSFLTSRGGLIRTQCLHNNKIPTIDSTLSLTLLPLHNSRRHHTPYSIHSCSHSVIRCA